MIELQQGKKWLIKSNSKLLGPFTADQIEELLRKKQISLIDEIRDMESRWQYLRENKFFSKAIEQVRKEIDSKSEATKTVQTTTQQSPTQTSSVVNNTAIHTQTKSFTDIELTETEAEIISEEKMPAEFNKVPDSMKVTGSKKTAYQNFVFEGDQKIVAVKRNISQKIWLNILIVVVVAFISAFGYYYYQKISLYKAETRLTSLFKKYKIQELDDQAIDSFVNLPSDLQDKVLPEAIEYFPKFESMGVLNVNNLLTKLKNYTLTPEEKVNLNLVNFLNYYHQQKYDQAEEELIKARTILPASLLVKENYAILNFMNKKYMESFLQFKELYEKEKLGRYLLGSFFAIEQLPDDQKKKLLPQLRSLIDRHVSINYDFKKELLLIQIYFTKVDQNTVLTELSLTEFFKTPCLMSKLFKLPTLLPNDFYVWDGLRSYIEKSMDKMQPVDASLFEVHVDIEKGQISSLGQLLEKINNSAQLATLKQHVNLLVNFYQSKYKEAIIVEKTKQLDMQNPLNHLLLGLAKLKINSNADINQHLTFLQELNERFYYDWLKIQQLKATKNLPLIRSFLVDHYLFQPSFIPALEAKGVLD